jgi:hypothetical protein
MSRPRESRSAAPVARLAAASRETINRIARPETRGMSSSALEVAVRTAFILAKGPSGTAWRNGPAGPLSDPREFFA